MIKLKKVSFLSLYPSWIWCSGLCIFFFPRCYYIQSSFIKFCSVFQSYITLGSSPLSVSLFIFGPLGVWVSFSFFFQWEWFYVSSIPRAFSYALKPAAAAVAAAAEAVEQQQHFSSWNSRLQCFFSCFSCRWCKELSLCLFYTPLKLVYERTHYKSISTTFYEQFVVPKKFYTP